MGFILSKFRVSFSTIIGIFKILTLHCMEHEFDSVFYISCFGPRLRISYVDFILIFGKRSSTYTAN